MKNEVKLRDQYDSLDLAVLSVKIEAKYKVDVFRDSIPETFGELRQRLIIDRDHPLFKDLGERFNNCAYITCYTSGTTGERKEVSHPYEFWAKHIRPGSPNDIWGLCYDPTHIAGIFVILQAFVNGCKLVLLYEHDNPGEEIIENGITHLSASSTFYRMLPGQYPNVKSVTIGSMRPLEDLKVKFPNATIRNIYATTEHGVIGVSRGDWFVFKPNMSVDSESGELSIDGKPTGDLVVLNGDKYFIRGRKNQFANVAGEKVYFEYVETVILQRNPHVKAIRVYALDNSVTGQLLFADVVKVTVDPIDLTGLKKFEIPIIEGVDEIQTTRNGKVKRT